MPLEQSLILLIPEIVLLVTILMILATTSLRRKATRLANQWAIAGLGISLLIILLTHALPHGIFSNYIVYDSYGRLIKIIAISSAILIFILYYHEPIATTASATYIDSTALILLLTICISGSSNHLIVLFFTLQIINIAVFLINQVTNPRHVAILAAWSDLIFSLAAGMISLLGIIIIYGMTGTFFISEIALRFSANPHLSKPLIIAFAMFFFGFTRTMTGFFRLHWTVKILRQQPVFSQMITSTLPQFAEIAILIRFLNTGLASFQHLASLSALLGIFGMMMLWYPIPWVFKYQNSEDRLNILSYSQTGFSLLALCTLGSNGYVAALFFQIVYIGSRLTLATGEILGPDHENLPGQIFSLASLIGIPLTAGFSAKYSVFNSLFINYPGYYFLIMAGLIAYIFMFVGYGNLIQVNILKKPLKISLFPENRHLVYLIRLILLLFILAGGIYWSPLTDYIRESLTFWIP